MPTRSRGDVAGMHTRTHHARGTHRAVGAGLHRLHAIHALRIRQRLQVRTSTEHATATCENSHACSIVRLECLESGRQRVGSDAVDGVARLRAMQRDGVHTAIR